MPSYETVIGFETHAELLSRTKVFDPCKAEFGGEPNTHVCPICLGLPGTLPVLNKTSLEMALKVCLALGCEIPEETVFDRKHYYYPDLPKNYQISQEYKPLGRGGGLNILVGNTEKFIRMNNVHLEEDAGKAMHDVKGGKAITHVDLNRAGTTLLEIVSEPDLRSPEEAEAFMKTMRNILRYLQVCDGKMQEGSMRFELNISLRPVGSTEYGTKVEVKNVGSIRAVLRALEYEVRRQTEILEDGGRVIQETRLWDDERGETRPMRTKEGAKDYRYFPEPDLPPLRLDRGYLSELAVSLPELRDAKRKRYVAEYGLPEYDATVLSGDRGVAEFFETCCSAKADSAKTFSNWIMTYILAELKDEDMDVTDLKVTPAHLLELDRLVSDGTISTTIAKKLFRDMLDGGEMPSRLVEKQSLKQVTDVDAIAKAVDEAIAENPGPWETYLSGKEATLNFFVGQVMRKTRGQAKVEMVQQLIRERAGL